MPEFNEKAKRQTLFQKDQIVILNDNNAEVVPLEYVIKDIRISAEGVTKYLIERKYVDRIHGSGQIVEKRLCAEDELRLSPINK